MAEVGAGTGTLAIAIAAARPDVAVAGIDGDPQILSLAQRKPGAGAVTWADGLADGLPIVDASVDVVVMSLLPHHLGPAAKRDALIEAKRVLRSGGRLIVADWGRPQDPAMAATFGVLRLVDGREGTRDHAAGRLPLIIEASGYRDVTRFLRLRTAWGSLELLKARRGPE